MVHLVENWVGIATTLVADWLCHIDTRQDQKLAPSAASRDLHSRAQASPNNFYEALDVYRISRILTNGSRLSHKARANQGIHSRVSGGSSA